MLHAPRVLDCFENRVLGDFVEGDAPGFLRGEPESLVKMPGNGFSLAVFIGSEPDGVRLGGKTLEFGYGFLLVRRNNILGSEAVVEVNAELLFLKVAYMSLRRHDFVVASEELLYCLRLVRGLDYH